MGHQLGLYTYIITFIQKISRGKTDASEQITNLKGRQRIKQRNKANKRGTSLVSLLAKRSEVSAIRLVSR